jgi:hypothetical protein
LLRLRLLRLRLLRLRLLRLRLRWGGTGRTLWVGKGAVGLGAAPALGLKEARDGAAVLLVSVVPQGTACVDAEVGQPPRADGGVEPGCVGVAVRACRALDTR